MEDYELDEVWVLCHLCENGSKRNIIGVVFMCGVVVFVILGKTKKTRLLVKINMVFVSQDNVLTC